MSNKKHLTAIQWLQYKIGEMGITHYFNLDQLIKQAKELEKQQIIDAYHINPKETKWDNQGIEYYKQNYEQ